MPDEPVIVRLTPNSPHLETIAGWQHEQWHYLNPELSFEAHCVEVRRECGEHGVPSVFVAMRGEQAVGTASLITHDMEPRPELTPWLASVFVLSEWRRQGIASHLVRRVEQEAHGAGIHRLYLFTPDQQALYRQLGWKDYENVIYRGEAVTIMAREFR